MTLFGPPPRRRRALTLLEVVLSMGLLVVLSSMTYWFYFTSISSRARGTQRASDLRLMRTALQRIAEEIRQAVVQSGDFGPGLLGSREAIEITTRRVPRRELAPERSSREPLPEPEYDLVKVQYKIARHPDILHQDGWEQPLGLARIERRIPRRIARAQDVGQDGGVEEEPSSSPGAFLREDSGFAEDAGGTASVGPEIDWDELYAPDIHYIRFCYYDGYSWWDDWTVTGENPLPQLVQITVGFGDHPPVEDALGEDDTNEQFCACLNKEPSDCEPLGIDEYMTVVRVTQADPLFRSRVSRESQLLAQELLQGGDEGGEEAPP